MTAPNSANNTLSGVTSFDLARELAGCREHKPWKSGLYSKLLLKADDLRIMLIVMETGAKIKEHHVDGTVSIHVLEGNVSIHARAQEHDLHNSQILTLAPGIKHDVEAREDSALLLTISWPGSEKLESIPHRGYGS